MATRSKARKKQSPMRDDLAGIQYAGEPGDTNECVDAVVRLVQCNSHVSRARILTSERNHCLLLTVCPGDAIAIKSGFGSGYGGEGPAGFSQALSLLRRTGLKSKSTRWHPSSSNVSTRPHLRYRIWRTWRKCAQFAPGGGAGTFPRGIG